MASSSTTLFLVSSLFTIFLHGVNGARLQVSGHLPDFIAKSCKLVPKDSYQTCLESFPDLQEKRNMNITSLAAYSMSYTADFAMNTTTSLQEVYNNLLGGDHPNSPLKTAIIFCREAYSDAADNIIDAIENFGPVKYSSSAYNSLVLARSAPGTCEYSLQGGTKDYYDLHKVNEKFSRLIEIPLTFFTLSEESPAPAPTV